MTKVEFTSDESRDAAFQRLGMQIDPLGRRLSVFRTTYTVAEQERQQGTIDAGYVRSMIDAALSKTTLKLREESPEDAMVRFGEPGSLIVIEIEHLAPPQPGDSFGR